MRRIEPSASLESRLGERLVERGIVQDPRGEGMSPYLVRRPVLGGRRHHGSVTTDVEHPHAYATDARLGLIPAGLWIQALDDYHTILRHMASARREKTPPPVVLGGIYELASEKHDTEGPPELEALDVGEHRLGSPNVGQHCRGLVDGEDGVAQRHEAVRDPARSAAELEDLCAGGDGVMQKLRLAEWRQRGVEVDRAAVRCGISH
jgi:hypothetical protein